MPSAPHDQDPALSVRYYGSNTPLPEQKLVRAGPLTAIFERGDLRYVRLGRAEVIRRWYAALRDRNWGTVPAELSALAIDASEDRFRITYDAVHIEGPIDFRWRATITGEPDGSITFVLDGKAHSTFLRSRIGFCLLHPIRECAGARVTVVRANGQTVEGVLPKFIAPVAPFDELRSFAHEVRPGTWAQLDFEGDVFEMEDQRNWLDASYKTFCTPLRLPYPVEVKEGSRIWQSVQLRLRDTNSTRVTVPTLALETTQFNLVSGSSFPLPELGTACNGDDAPLTKTELDRLRALNLSHLRVELRLSEAGWKERLRQAAAESAQLGAPLEVAVLAGDAFDAELDRLARAVGEIRPQIRRWLVFRAATHITSGALARAARKQLGGLATDAQIGGGTDAYFTELNRDRPPIEALEAVCYSVTPQVHAFDNASLVETLAAHADTLASARQFSGSLPLGITPVTLRPRFNPYATGPEPVAAPGTLPGQVDPRQMSLFGAGWTLGSVKYASEGGASWLTYFEASGWRGLMERSAGSALPDRFSSMPGAVFPVFQLLADLGEFRGGRVMSSRSSEPLKVDGLAVQLGERLRLLLANSTGAPQPVVIGQVSGPGALRMLDANSFGLACRQPEAFRVQPAAAIAAEPVGGFTLELPAFALARLDFTAYER